MGIRKPRTDYNPDVVERAVCPGCALRLGGVIHPACPICAGHGRITLGRAALAYDPPDIVASAIALALNASADAVQSATDLLDIHHQVLPATLARLTALGILDPTPTTREAIPCASPPHQSLSTSLGPPSRPRPRGTRRAWPCPGQLTLWPA